MPKRKAKKESSFQTEMTKSVFLHGTPNKGKADALLAAQDLFLREVNRFIYLIHAAEELLPFLVSGDNRGPKPRAFEKENRADDVSATFSQAAFDEAFTKLSVRMDTIRKNILAFEDCCLAMSKVLFPMVITRRTKAEMITRICEVRATYKKIPERFFTWEKELNEMSDDEFRDTCDFIRILYDTESMSYRIPEVKACDVRLVSTNFEFSLSDTVRAGAVITISLPKGITAENGEGKISNRITVPLLMSVDAKRRLVKYGACHSAAYRLLPDGKIKVTIAFKKKNVNPDITSVKGVDVGITDALHTPDGAIGTMKDVIDFYKNVVEPLFAEKTKLINKKRKLKKYISRHTLPEDVKKQIRDKIDHLEKNIREVKNACRQSRRYHAMLKKRVKDVVVEYIRSLKGDKTILTALELLDINEFNKSRKVNGMFSTFARGLLSKTLMDELNWHGYAFRQVDPAYTSQACPVCSYTDENNRNGKTFRCLCCGHEDDADSVGCINIGSRASDEELLSVCEKFKYSKNARHKAIKAELESRNNAWIGVRIRPVTD